MGMEFLLGRGTVIIIPSPFRPSLSHHDNSAHWAHFVSAMVDLWSSIGLGDSLQFDCRQSPFTIPFPPTTPALNAVCPLSLGYLLN